MRSIGLTLVTVVTLIVALVAAEAATRWIDGYPLRLRLVARTDTHQKSASEKWVDPAAAVYYVDRLPVAAGVDRAWFSLNPAPRPAVRTDPVLDRRYWSHKGFELSSIYEWNERYVQRAVCGETRLQMPVFSNVPDLFMYQALDGDIYPQFRYMRSVRYPSGLRTNAFGWRGADLELVKRPNTIRIAFVGASTTIDPHSDPFSHPEYIETWLNAWGRARQQPFHFEVINAGREGIDIQGVRAVVTQEIVPVRPDLVIDYEGGNQFWPVDFIHRVLPPRPKTTAGQPWSIESFSAVAVRLHQAFKGVEVRDGGEPRKPALPVDWPKDLDEHDPPLDDPRLPTSLPRIVREMDAMRTSLAAIGATYVPSSFLWFVQPGMVLDPKRDSGIFTFLNVTYWPFSYAHMRRIADFQNRVFKKYAAVHQLPFVDLAAVYPFDARLFFDAVHMTPAGIKLKGWLMFQQLVPEIERRIGDGRLPVPDPGGRASHPAFAGSRRLVQLDDLRRSCGSVEHPAGQ